MDGWMKGYISGWVGGWMDGRAGVWVEGWVGGWVENKWMVSWSAGGRGPKTTRVYL